MYLTDAATQHGSFLVHVTSIVSWWKGKGYHLSLTYAHCGGISRLEFPWAGSPWKGSRVHRPSPYRLRDLWKFRLPKPGNCVLLCLLWAPSKMSLHGALFGVIPTGDNWAFQVYEIAKDSTSLSKTLLCEIVFSYPPHPTKILKF